MDKNKRVLFADLDGTLIQTKTGNTFARGLWDWMLKPGIHEALVKYNPDALYIVTNQGGIEKGTVREADFIKKINDIVKKLQGILPECVVKFNYCTSNDPQNPRRKPNSGMYEEFYNDPGLGGFSKSLALMIGDASGKQGQFSDSDLESAMAFGIDYCDIGDFIHAMIVPREDLGKYIKSYCGEDE